MPVCLMAGKHNYKRASTPIPEPIIPGIKAWRTESGVSIVRLHYTADPDRCTDEWLNRQLQGYDGGMDGRKWRMEMEIDFAAYGGAPVYPEFDTACITKVNYNPDLELWRGWDFGYRHPAVTWWQLWPGDDVLVCLHEYYPTLDPTLVPGMDALTLGRNVKAETARLFPEAYSADAAPIKDFGDPSGQAHKDTSEMSTVEQLTQLDIQMDWQRVSRKYRIAKIRNYVWRKKLRIDPSCVLIIKGFSGAYRYPEPTRAGVGPRDPEMPDVSGKVQQEPYIHIMDSAEYMAACCLPEMYRPSGANTPIPVKNDNNNTYQMDLHGSALDCVAKWYKQRQDIPEEVSDLDLMIQGSLTLEPSDLEIEDA